MRARQKRKLDSMTIKLDIFKAYDRVDWVYLENIMRKLDFVDQWTSKVMACVTIVIYSVMVNG